MFCDPRHLAHLDKIEADVCIRCRHCKFDDDRTVSALSRHLHETGGGTVWSELTRSLSCRRFGCGSLDVRALIVPYARRPANMPRRVGELDRRIVDAALAILTDAAQTRSNSAATLDVRLALSWNSRAPGLPPLYSRPLTLMTLRLWTSAGVASTARVARIVLADTIKVRIIGTSSIGG